MAVTFAFFINLCDLIYQCGCQSLWAGAAEHCNVHVAGVKHCPFCAHGNTGYASVLALVLIPQFLISWRYRWNWRIRLIVAVLVFPAATVLAAVVMGLADGYWS